MSKHPNGTDDTRLGDELGHELHQRATVMDRSHLSLAEVKGRAGSIRRTRRIVTATASLAAAAVIVPVAIFAGQGLDRAQTIDPANPGTSQSPTPTPGVQPQPGPHALNVDATQGPPAASPYLDRTTLIRPDGSTLELPKQYDTFRLVGDEFVGFRYSDGVVDVVDARGKITRTVPGVTGLTGNDAQAVWSTSDGDLVGWTDGTDSLLATPGGEIRVKAVTGDLRRADFTVYFDRGFGEAPMKTVNGEPAEPITAQDAVVVTDNDESGRTALRISTSDAGSCSGVHDAATDDYLWETCDYALSTFSPDGRYVLAPPAYGDGLGDGTLAVLDAATGELVSAFEIDGGFISFSAWEDGDHPLVVIHDSRGWRVLRLGLDGSIGLVAGPVTSADEMDNPFRLLGTP